MKYSSEKKPSKLLTCLFLSTSTYTFKLLITPISFLCRVQLSLCFSLSEPQHLRKTHQCRQYDDVIRWEPAASKPVHRWQCCTSKPHFKPCQPSSPELAHILWVHGESLDHSYYWFMCVSVGFCPLCATKICTWQQNKTKWILKWVILIQAWRQPPPISRGLC